MKSSFIRIFALALALGCPTAHATLVGDTITVTHRFPNLGTVDSTLAANLVVQAGNGDAVNYFTFYSVNPEASSIKVVFLTSAGWTPAAFNGLVVSGINDTITSLSVSTNLVGWDNSRISFDAHSVSANWQNLDFSSNSFFDVFFELNGIPGGNSTPDSGTTAAMLGLAILGLAAIRRRAV